MNSRLNCGGGAASVHPLGSTRWRGTGRGRYFGIRLCTSQTRHGRQSLAMIAQSSTAGSALAKWGAPRHLTLNVTGSAVGGAWNMPVWNRNRRILATVSRASR